MGVGAFLASLLTFKSQIIMKLDHNSEFNTIMLIDGGVETELVFKHNIDLPGFATFPLIDKPECMKILDKYSRDFLELARDNNVGFILESTTWRANPQWGAELGYSAAELERVNKQSIDILKKLKDEYENDVKLILISGCIGPRYDGYVVGNMMEPDQAKEFHQVQISTLKNAGAELITAYTITNLNEGLGIVQAAKEENIPVVLSFTLELDGALPSGETLSSAINKIDQVTGQYPAYYMINCAHPTHFIKQIDNDEDWRLRIKGIRANASTKSHAELDNSTELDAGDKHDLANWHLKLKTHLPNLMVYGGCCGTDLSHVREICQKVTG